MIIIIVVIIGRVRAVASRHVLAPVGLAPAPPRPRRLLPLPPGKLRAFMV